VALLFINKKNKVKINITGKWQHCHCFFKSSWVVKSLKCHHPVWH